MRQYFYTSIAATCSFAFCSLESRESLTSLLLSALLYWKAWVSHRTVSLKSTSYINPAGAMELDIHVNSLHFTCSETILQTWRSPSTCLLKTPFRSKRLIVLQRRWDLAPRAGEGQGIHSPHGLGAGPHCTTTLLSNICFMLLAQFRQRRLFWQH